MGVEPPFIYDRPAAYTFGGPTQRGFDPKAATRASWEPKTQKTKKDGPLVDFNKHPDSFIQVPYGNLNVQPMPQSTRKIVIRTRWVLFGLRVCALLGALGILFCVIAINKTSSAVGWIIRVAPAVAIVHNLYGVYHLCRSAIARPPASSASYMIFSSLFDAGLIPFFAFSAYMAHGDYTTNAYGWGTLFNDDAITYKITHAFFLLAAIEAGLLVVSLVLDLYLAVKFRQIARMPPDMNPLEPNLTSRHKRNKSSMTICEKNNRASEVSFRKDSPLAGKRVPFIHTRTDSADSVTLYGNDSARNSRLEFRKEMDEARKSKDVWPWSRQSSPERPASTHSPSANARGAGVGLDFRPERSSQLAEKPSRPSSWLSYLDYEGVPSTLSDEANAELDQEVRPVSPMSAVSYDPSIERRHKERDAVYTSSPRSSARNSQVQLCPTHGLANSPTVVHHSNASKINLAEALAPPQGYEPQPKRSREPLAMNPPTPVKATFPQNEQPTHFYHDENAHATTATTTPKRDFSFAGTYEVLNDTTGNARPKNTSRPSSFVGSGTKGRFYGDLRGSIGSISSLEKGAHGHAEEVDLDRSKTIHSESDYSANFEVYASDSEDEVLSARIERVRPVHGTPIQTMGPATSINVQPATPTKVNESPRTWNGARQTSNSTGYDLHSGYAGLGVEFGKGMGRRREVSGKVAEEGRAETPKKNGAEGWARFKGL